MKGGPWSVACSVSIKSLLESETPDELSFRCACSSYSHCNNTRSCRILCSVGKVQRKIQWEEVLLANQTWRPLLLEKCMSREEHESHGLIFGGRLTETSFLITPRIHAWTRCLSPARPVRRVLSYTNKTDCVRYPNTTAPINGGNCVLSQLTTGDNRHSSASRLTRIIQ